jgi:hypothetical protein
MKRSIAAVSAATTAAGLALAPWAVSQAATTSAGAGQARPASALPVIHVAMTGKKITVSGALQSGGVRVASSVTGESSGQPTFIRLDPGVTVAQFERALPAIGADPNNLYGIGRIVMSAMAPKGTSSVQVSLAPGHYVAGDIAPSGVPPLAAFTVTPASAPARLPRPAATVAAIEFAFRGASRLHDGELVRFENRGFLVHMIVAMRGSSLAGARQIARLLYQGRDRQAQKLSSGFASYANLLSHAAAQQLIVSSKPGYWVLACFMDTQDGREHTQLGMERVIRIVR